MLFKLYAFLALYLERFELASATYIYIYIYTHTHTHIYVCMYSISILLYNLFF